MKHHLLSLAFAGVLATGASVITHSEASHPQAAQAPPAGQATATPAPPDPIRDLVGHLELERYKATLKGLAQFGDWQQGTKRNRDAVDWIEAQLKSYGCTNTERVIYDTRQRHEVAVPGAALSLAPVPGRRALLDKVRQRRAQAEPPVPDRLPEAGKPLLVVRGPVARARAGVEAKRPRRRSRVQPSGCVAAARAVQRSTDSADARA